MPYIPPSDRSIEVMIFAPEEKPDKQQYSCRKRDKECPIVITMLCHSFLLLLMLELQLEQACHRRGLSPLLTIMRILGGSASPCQAFIGLENC